MVNKQTNKTKMNDVKTQNRKKILQNPCPCSSDSHIHSTDRNTVQSTILIL